MANGLFTYQDPRVLEQQFLAQRTLSPAQMAQLNPLQQVIAMGANTGANLGNTIGRMFGGQTSAEVENEAMKRIFTQASQATTDPAERLKVAASLFRQQGMEDRAQALEDRLLNTQKTQADIGRLNALAQGGGRTGGVGTGPERMATFIADVDARTAAGQPVTDVERRTADNFRTVLSSVKTYKMPDGSILRVAVKDFSAQQRAEAQGGIEVPTGVAPQAPQAPQTGQPQPRPAPQATGGAQVIETPASVSARKKEQQGIQNQIDTISADLENINEALQLVSPRSAGIAGVLGIVPQTDARRVQKLIEGIDAAKVFNELTKLREASASGASGLGQVTEREISLLQNRLRVLDPFGEPDKLKADLQYIANAWTSIQDRLKESQTPTGQPTERPSEQPKANNQDEALIQRWMAANPGKSREQVVQGLKRRGLIK